MSVWMKRPVFHKPGPSGSVKTEDGTVCLLGSLSCRGGDGGLTVCRVYVVEVSIVVEEVKEKVSVVVVVGVVTKLPSTCGHVNNGARLYGSDKG